MTYRLCKILLGGLFLAMSAITAHADIVENLNRSGSTVTVEQPDALSQRLHAPANVDDQTGDASDETNPGSESDERENAPVMRSKGKIVGYRVQVYADNNPRTAKGEARVRERAIGRRFPYTTYVAYASPYWRLRVGDFRTLPEAEKAAAEIKRAFPGYAREVRIVRDRINAH